MKKSADKTTTFATKEPRFNWDFKTRETAKKVGDIFRELEEEAFRKHIWHSK